jgi:CubicO group peptidase (beta-lactamase class C family)
MHGSSRFFRAGALLTALVWAAGCAQAPTPPGDATPAAHDVFPDAAWRTSTPEAQGLDSAALVALFDAVQAERWPIHSLQIVRHGHLVLDAYFHPFARGQRHDIASVTKSVTTTLIGLAIERGVVPGVDAPVFALLGEAAPADARKAQILVRHLLTTTSALDCSAEPYEREMLAMAASPDWVRFALDLPMREAPGTRFVYCSPGFHLLSALITRRTGQSAQAFARQALFAPLGITDLRWPHDPQGHSQGAGDLQMLPADLLRVGYLFLRHGAWNGRQVVPRAWVEQATRHQVDTAPGGDGYGFGWWLSRAIPGLVEGRGRGGQRLIVWPAKDIVIVITGGGLDVDVVAPYLRRALKSDAPLRADPAVLDRLAQRVRVVAAPPAPSSSPSTAPALPPQAAAIDGRTYALEPNLLGVQRLQLRFSGADGAQVRFGLRDGDVVVPVGLAGVEAFGTDPASGDRVAGLGRWSGPNEFVLEVDTIARINRFTLVLRFDSDRLRAEVSERGGLVRALPVVGRAMP